MSRGILTLLNITRMKGKLEMRSVRVACRENRFSSVSLYASRIFLFLETLLCSDENLSSGLRIRVDEATCCGFPAKARLL